MKFWIILSTLVITTFTAFSQRNDTLVVGYNESPPFVVNKEDMPQGPSVWLWEKVASETQIPYKYVELSLDSLLKSLENGTVDVSLSPLTITRKRSEVIDFSSPYYIAYSTILQKDVSSLENTMAFVNSFFSINFFRALSTLALVILIFGLLIWLFERKANEHEFGNGLKGLWHGFWWSAVTMTTVGYGDKSPKTAGGRVIAIIWMFTAIVIISGLSASIASSLTIKKIGSSNNTIMEFKDNTLGTINNSATDEWLAKNFFTHKETYASMDELFNALDEDRIDAIAYDRPLLKSTINSKNWSGYRILNINYNSQFYAMGMNRELSKQIKHDMNLAILKNIESMDWKVLISEYGLKVK